MPATAPGGVTGPVVRGVRTRHGTTPARDSGATTATTVTPVAALAAAPAVLVAVAVALAMTGAPAGDLLGTRMVPTPGAGADRAGLTIAAYHGATLPGRTCSPDGRGACRSATRSRAMTRTASAARTAAADSARPQMTCGAGLASGAQAGAGARLEAEARAGAGPRAGAEA
jgi:hypothetical protein